MASVKADKAAEKANEEIFSDIHNTNNDFYYYY